jgi:hypothetical protein
MGTEQNHLPESFDRVESNSIFKRTHFAHLAVIENESTIAHKRRQSLLHKIKAVLAALFPSMWILYHCAVKTAMRCHDGAQSISIGRANSFIRIG